MAARKLQADIDRVLKLVHQGVTNFEETFEKMSNATNQTSKDKAEADLKTSIKKLQRQREQIKIWLQNNDIKDKSSLMEHRKLIEQMERFKACEKEMKTKAFSKEGLSAQHRLDPKEAAKADLSAWVSSMVDELSLQIERAEAEVEGLRGQSRKKKVNADGRGSELEALNDQRRWHISKLELIMRLLENGQITVDSVQGVKDDIQYYVESNAEEDFTEDKDLYDTLNLSEEEDQFGMPDEAQSSHDASSIVDDSPASQRYETLTNHRRGSKPLSISNHDYDGEKSPTKEKAPRGPSTRKATLDSTTPRPVISSTRSAGQASTTTTAPPPRPVPTTLPPMRYSIAAAAAASSPVVSSTPVMATPSNSSVKSPIVSSPTSTLATAPAKKHNTLDSPEIKKPTIPRPADLPAKPVMSLPAAPPPPSLPITDTIVKSEPSMNERVTANTGVATSLSPPGLSNSAKLPNSDVEGDSHSHLTSQPSPNHSAEALNVVGSKHSVISAEPLSPKSHANTSTSYNSLPAPTLSDAVPATQTQPPSHTLEQVQVAPSFSAITTHSTTPNDAPRLPSSLADLVGTFEVLKAREPDFKRASTLVASGLQNVPQPNDSEKPQGYVAKYPYRTANWYPNEPVEGGWIRKVELWGLCDVDVLFFVFYYLPGGYHQFLAARELKKRAWRFHKQYLTWFQRADEPVEMTDDYEAGAYVYFDWEKHWALRQKPHFTFEYKFLEDSF